jgi:hypothetical protein
MMLIRQVVEMIEDLQMDIVCLWEANLVSWRSKKQVVVARSTAEAEYRAMALALCEMMWLKGMLKELQLLRKEIMLLHCDNVAAINIANNPIQFDRIKHVEIDRFFIKEKIDMRVLKLGYIQVL